MLTNRTKDQGSEMDSWSDTSMHMLFEALVVIMSVGAEDT